VDFVFAKAEHVYVVVANEAVILVSHDWRIKRVSQEHDRFPIANSASFEADLHAGGSEATSVVAVVFRRPGEGIEDHVEYCHLFELSFLVTDPACSLHARRKGTFSSGTIP